MASKPDPVRSLGTAISVVDALHELGTAGVSAVANHVGLPTSTAHDHLATLERHGLVVKEGSEYRVGTRFLEIGGYARSQDEVYRTARPEIKKLAVETGEHANLMIEEAGRGVFLCKEEGGDAFQLDTHVGKSVHLQSTALGKAILAFLPEERVVEIVDRHGFPRVTENTITDRETLFEELEEVRERGIATDDEERIPGVRCVAAPFHDPEGEVAGAVSVSGPKSGLQDETFSRELPDQVTRASNVIEVNLKYR